MMPRIWHEIGWLDRTNQSHADALNYLIEAGPALVARVDGAAECAALAAYGTLRYLETDLRLAGITAVVTSPIARRRGLASRTTAQLVADCATGGAEVALLGIFDQGYYDRLGFGAGCYEHRIRVAPRHLRVPFPEQTVHRLTPEDWQEMHDCRLHRGRRHGFLSLDSPLITRAQSLWSKNGMGLGFRDRQGGLTHFLWYETDNREEGPFRIPSVFRI